MKLPVNDLPLFILNRRVEEIADLKEVHKNKKEPVNNCPECNRILRSISENILVIWGFNPSSGCELIYASSKDKGWSDYGLIGKGGFVDKCTNSVFDLSGRKISGPNDTPCTLEVPPYTLANGEIEINSTVTPQERINEVNQKEFLERYQKAYLERDLAKRYTLLSDLVKTDNEYNQYTVLSSVAIAAFDFAKYAEAKKHADRLLQLSKKYPDDWNFGNAIHDGNMVLGLLASYEGKINSSVKYLLMAGDTPGSPQLNTFGPNMSLAKDLLEQGQEESVIEYLEKCKLFWELEDGRLDSWIAAIRGGGIPYFGSNLYKFE